MKHFPCGKFTHRCSILNEVLKHQHKTVKLSFKTRWRTKGRNSKVRRLRRVGLFKNAYFYTLFLQLF
ncbi:hypothetical protein HMPREF9554_00947 [Treponema phagedenis F0421]|nr:hypothetical protein HMPREF9554_00947 [Treponema phagedenis F0421]